MLRASTQNGIAQPPDSGPSILRFGEFEIDREHGRLFRGGRLVELPRSSFDLLCCLAIHAPATVDKERLFQHGWPGRVVSENSLAKAMGQLRRALGDEHATVVVTVHGYGYRLSVECIALLALDPQPAAEPRSVEPDQCSNVAAKAVETPVPRLTEAPRHESMWMRISQVAQRAGVATRQTKPLVFGIFVIATGLMLIAAKQFWPASAIPNLRQNTPVIAVVPFRDLSADGSLELFARGISDHLRNDAMRIPGLDIIDRGSSAVFQEDGHNAASIGHALGATLVVGGDVRANGTALEVELRITDMSARLPAHRSRFQRAAPEQATLLDDLTLAMFKALSPQDGRFGLHPGRGGGTANAEAYLAFLRASTTLISNNDPNSQRRTIATLEHAVELDPNYADAWLMLGGVLGGSGYYADTPEQLSAGRVCAIAAMDRGIALAPSDPWNYLTRSEMRLLYQFDWHGAQADIDAARQLTPVDQSEAMILIWQARFAASMNHIDQAIALGSRSITLSPTAGGRRNQGWHFLARRDTRNARAVLTLQLKDLPESPHVHFYLALCDIFDRQPAMALQRLEFSSPMFRLLGTAIAQHELGNQAASDVALNALKDRFTPADAYWVATAYAWRGEADLAFEWLENAKRAGDSSLMYLPFDPMWQPLRQDPRMGYWTQLLAAPAEIATQYR